MGKVILYGMATSPPVRAVLLTLGALGIDYEFRIVDLINSEQLNEEFVKKNPQHTVPLLEDDGQYIWDSHAIAAYLVRKYGKNDLLYPKDYYQRAVVDQRLHFDSGVLFPSLTKTSFPWFFKNDTDINQEKRAAIENSYNFLEIFLQHDYVAGDHPTIADFSIISTLTSLELFVPVDPAKLPKITAWLKQMIALPYYARAQDEGMAAYSKLVKDRLAST